MKIKNKSSHDSMIVLMENLNPGFFFFPFKSLYMTHKYILFDLVNACESESCSVMSDSL